jgi:hypothetical protein
VFENKVSSLTAFCQLSKDNVSMQLLAKGSLLIKDAKQLNSGAYSDFIAVFSCLKEENINSIAYTLLLSFYLVADVNTFL